MPRPDALFLLTKSLSPVEKALVRQSDKGQAGYIALFDLIGKQKEYDERKAKKKLAALGHDINFAYAKNYLTKQILRVIRENEDAGPRASSRMLHEVEILMRRKVYDLAEKLLLKAKEKCLAEERWEEFLQLSTMELDLVLMQEDKAEATHSAILAINQSRQEARQKMGNLGEFQDLYYSHRPLIKRKQNARNEWDLQLIQQLGSHHLMQGKGGASSERARRLYWMCQTMVAAFTGDMKAVHLGLTSAVAQYREHGFLVEDYPEAFLNELVRLGGSHLHRGDWADVESLLAEIKDFQQKRGLHASELFDKYYRLLTGFALASGKYARINSELSAIEEGLATYEEVLPWASQSNLIFLVGRLLFEQGELREAKKWLGRILDHTNRGIREDLSSLARILTIFIYLDLGEGELVESQAKATRKYLQRRDSLFKFEKRILKFLEDNSFGTSLGAMQGELKALRTDLAKIFEDPLEANVQNYFDFLSWLDKRTR